MRVDADKRCKLSLEISIKFILKTTYMVVSFTCTVSQAQLSSKQPGFIIEKPKIWSNIYMSYK